MPRQVVIKCGDALLESWVKNMSSLLPNDFQVLPYNSDEIAPSNVAYIIGWKPDAHWINTFPSLRALVSIGSGVDHIANLADLRADVPVIRTVSPDLIQRMREYVAMCVLAWHRQLVPIIETNRKHKWDRFAVDVAGSVHVGVMGYGSMGKAVAATLASLGYAVSVWADSEREGLPFKYYRGRGQLYEFAAECDVVVCLVDDDVIRATSDGTLSLAFVDGLRQEPLGEDSPLWDAPGVIVTCHSAAYISPDAGPRIIAANIERFDAGEVVSPMYDPGRGF